jgi:glycosyltransferase involved in cell wall biosynthesis
MDFVFLSTQGWSEMGGAGRPLHFFARELLARGHSVLFVEVVASQGAAAHERLTVVSFEALGYDERALRRAWFGLNPHIDSREALAGALDAFESPNAERVVVYGDPFVPFVEWFGLLRARGYKIVYDALDDFDAFPEIGLFFANRAAEAYLVANSDVALAVSTTLVQKFQNWTSRAPVRLLRQGFDSQTFYVGNSRAPRPKQSSDSSQGALTLGFWGQVNSFNVNVELLEAVARARPAWTIQLIGPVDYDPQLPPVRDRLSALPNVSLVGQVPHDTLPDYLQAFDAALIPFPANAFNRARDPLKVYEYLSGSKPVIASNTPQLADMPYVYLADSPEEFVMTVERAVATPIEQTVVDDYLVECTWTKRTDRLLELVDNASRGTVDGTFDANQAYEDEQIPTNVREYIHRTETLLAERSAFLSSLMSDSAAKQAYIDRLEASNPLWHIKRAFARE